MSHSVMELCVPLRVSEAETILAEPDVFSSTSIGFYRSRRILSGLVFSDANTNHLVQQAALSASYLGREVLVVLGCGRWREGPPTFHNLPSTTPELIDRIKFMYPTNLQDLIQYLAELEEDQVPETIVIQHLDRLIKHDYLDTEDEDPEDRLPESIVLIQFVSFVNDLLVHNNMRTACSSQQLGSKQQLSKKFNSSWEMLGCDPLSDSNSSDDPDREENLELNDGVHESGKDIATAKGKGNKPYVKDQMDHLEFIHFIMESEKERENDKSSTSDSEYVSSAGDTIEEKKSKESLPTFDQKTMSKAKDINVSRNNDVFQQPAATLDSPQTISIPRVSLKRRQSGVVYDKTGVEDRRHENGTESDNKVAEIKLSNVKENDELYTNAKKCINEYPEIEYFENDKEDLLETKKVKLVGKNEFNYEITEFEQDDNLSNIENDLNISQAKIEPSVADNKPIDKQSETESCSKINEEIRNDAGKTENSLSKDENLDVSEIRHVDDRSRMTKKRVKRKSENLEEQLSVRITEEEYRKVSEKFDDSEYDENIENLLDKSSDSDESIRLTFVPSDSDYSGEESDTSSVYDDPFLTSSPVLTSTRRKQRITTVEEKERESPSDPMSEPELLCFGGFSGLHSEVKKLNLWWKEIWKLSKEEEEDYTLTCLSTERELNVSYTLQQGHYCLNKIATKSQTVDISM